MYSIEHWQVKDLDGCSLYVVLSQGNILQNWYISRRNREVEHPPFLFFQTRAFEEGMQLTNDSTIKNVEESEIEFAGLFRV